MSSLFGENIKSSVWGAQGNDSNDDRSYIQAAIDYVSGLGGGQVTAPRGIYRIGKHPTQPYGLLIPSNVRLVGTGWGVTTFKHYGNAGAAAFALIQVEDGGSFIEIENITLDQSGLSNPLTAECPLININDVDVLKLIRVQCKGGVTDAGAYFNFEGNATKVWMTGCELIDAGGVPLWVSGSLDVWWLTKSVIEQGTGDDALLLAGSGVVSNGKVKGCRITGTASYAIRVTDDAARTALQFDTNDVFGFVALAGLDHSHFINNQVYATASGITDPVLDVTDSTSNLFKDNIVSRASTCDDGLVTRFDTATRTGVHVNHWLQDTEAGLVHWIDPTHCQSAGNIAEVTDIATGHDAILVEAVAVTVDNFQSLGENITANAGTWDNVIHFKSNSGSFGVLQVIPGIFDDCDVGVYFDENGGGASKFTSRMMVAGGLIDANTKAWEVSASGMYVRIGSNASTFGPEWISGDGVANSAVTARVGGVYSRRDGGSGTSLEIKESGTGTTTWDPK